MRAVIVGLAVLFGVGRILDIFRHTDGGTMCRATNPEHERDSRGREKVWSMVALAGLLSGCTSLIPYKYSDSLSPQDASAIVDRALTTQPRQFAAEYVEITPDYIAYGEGTVTTERGQAIGVPVGNATLAIGSSRTTSRSLSNRLYFDTLTEALLYSRRSHFVVKVLSTDGQPARHFYLYSEDLGKRLIDALYSLKRQWASMRYARKVEPQQSGSLP